MCEPLSVDPAGPAGMAGDVVLLRPLSLQEPLGPAVAHLLFPERAHRVSAMLHPGMCSASRSDTRTCAGLPGAFAMLSAIHPSPGGAMFGPPTAACLVLRNVAAR